MNDIYTFSQDDVEYLKTLSILYVEDEEGIRNQLTQFLKRRCAAVHIAANGKIGLEAFRLRRPDIVVTDILMPVIDGLKMCEGIRASNNHVPIVITTAFEDIQYLQTAIDLGVDKYVTKPVDPEILESALLKCARTIRAEAALREIQERYQVLFTFSQLPISIAGAPNGTQADMDSVLSAIIENSRILDCNSAFLQLTGYEDIQALRRRTLNELTKAEYRPGIKRAIMEELLVLGFTREVELEILRLDGQITNVMAQFILRRNDKGEPMEMWALMRDISEQRLAEKQLLLAQKVYENTRDAIIITDADNNIVSINAAFTHITGYSAEEVLGCNPRILQSGRHDKAFYQQFWQSVLEQGHWQGEVWNRRKNGEIFTEWLSITTVKDSTGRIVNFIGIFSDITETMAAREFIAFLAHYDPLTHLPNRVLLNDRLTQALSTARRQDHRVAIFFLDLDRFKNINDSMGHNVGDMLLTEVAGRLGQAVREVDTLARLGGDEFVLVQPAVSDLTDAVSLAQKIIASLRKPFVLKGQDVTVSVSVGIAMFPEDGEDIDTLLKNADAAMYSAKQNGRDNYEFFTSSMNLSALERFSMENQLRRALEQGQFELFYQPQMECESGRLVGMEALLRWRHPDFGLLPPAKFISLSEETGLIIPIGTWVLREACRQNAQWQRQGLLRVPVAVNLSAVQFRQPELRETVTLALRDSGLDASWLELELTESIVMREAEAAIATLRALKSSGVKLSIDDFGTGYSSLSYLKRFPIDKLKIDRSFVQNIPADAEDATITRTIISLAHEMGLGVIAEGVETPEQLHLLKAQQCDHAQGYFFSQPVPADKMGILLNSDMY